MEMGSGERRHNREDRQIEERRERVTHIRTTPWYTRTLHLYLVSRLFGRTPCDIIAVAFFSELLRRELRR